MIDIPVNAKVECSDGDCGESTAVLINPVTQEVTHFVVQDKSPRPVERLVSVDQVVGTTSKLIRLSCTQDELAEMEPFVDTHYLESQEQKFAYSGDTRAYFLPYGVTYEPVYTPVEEERVPPGQLAVHRGSIVEATDGYVGRLGEFLVDPDSGHLTHLVLQEGHLWGKKEVVLPVSAIDRAYDETVYLKLDKRAVESLPAIQVRRQYEKAKAEGKNIELIAKVFDDPDGASEALEYVKGLQKSKALKILNSAILVKDEEGETSLKEAGDVDVRRGRLFGAITGGLIGLVGGPVGVVVGALAGAGTGGLAAKWIDMGFSDKFLVGLQERLEPGSSALILLIEDQWAEQASEALKDVEGLIFQQTLTDELVGQLMEEDDAEAGGD